MKHALLIIILFTAFSVCPGQNRLEKIQAQLDSLAVFVPELNEPTNISLRDVSLAEYIRSIGIAHQINVFIDDTPSIILTNSLTHEPVKSVFLFICKQFDYTLEISGSIIIFKPYQQPAPKTPQPKPLNITFSEGKLSLDLKRDSLYPVIKQISKLTGQKIITTPNAEGQLTAYLPPTPLDTALEALFWANGMKISNRKKGYYIVQPVFVPTDENISPQPAKQQTTSGRTDFTIESFRDADHEYISLDAKDADLEALLETIFAELESNYLIYGHLSGQITIGAEITRLEDLLRYLLQGTEFTYKKEGNLYLIGPKDLEGLYTTQIVRMKYRPTFQAIELIPGIASGANSTPLSTPYNLQNQPNHLSINRQRNDQNPEYTQNDGLFDNSSSPNIPSQTSLPPEIIQTEVSGVSIVEYPELNRIILKGPTDKVEELAYFLQEIDQPVPMVRIEMVVVEVNKNRMISTGLKAGFRSPNDSSSINREVLPGVDYTLNGSELNTLLSNIPMLSNIGSLSDDFYVQLKAQEARGNVKIRMEPVLSMLNGREASLTIGQTQYYLLETQTASTGAVNNFQQFTQRFEQIEANISLSLKPYISEDEVVTLDVIPDFTTPVGSFDADVPPTIATRRFVSTIRVRHGETVILGGLTQNEKRENTRGLPFLSRIPVLKWIFGNVDKTKSESSLLIYITPEIFYY